MQERVKTSASNAFAWSTARLDVYTPEVAALRACVQKQYLASPLSKGWLPAMLDKINAL